MRARCTDEEWREYYRLRRLAGFPERTSAKNVAHVAAWRMANPGARLAQESLRRARKRGGSVGDLALVRQFFVWLREAGVVICYWCREAVPLDKRRGDHKIPLARGGPHCLENLVPACECCNSRKGSKLPEEFI